MPKDTVYTKAFEKAHASINRSFEMARKRTGDVPIGHHLIDPRTAAKRSAFNLQGALDEMRQGQAGADNASNSNTIQDKPFFSYRYQLPVDKGQNPKHAAAGKVVESSGIDTYHGADGVSLETAKEGGPA